MKIDFIHLQNFRKLKSCRIDLSDKKTIFVGANNRGKTSAMDALITFFKSKDLTTRDFTLSNWQAINELCAKWEGEADPAKRDHRLALWEQYLPTLDVWLTVDTKEIHHVSHLIPTLSWRGGSIGVRLRYQPKKVDELCNDYCQEIGNSRALSTAGSSGTSKYQFWPKDMWNYLDRDKMLASQFEMKAYVLDPLKKDEPEPQSLPMDVEPMEESAFAGLIKIDIIQAERGFSDVNAECIENSKIKNLSNQLRQYYEKHLNPSLKPTTGDIKHVSEYKIA